YRFSNCVLNPKPTYKVCESDEGNASLRYSIDKKICKLFIRLNRYNTSTCCKNRRPFSITEGIEDTANNRSPNIPVFRSRVVRYRFVLDSIAIRFHSYDKRTIASEKLFPTG